MINNTVLTSDKLMLPKHTAIAKFWDEQKQELWGFYAELAIMLTSDKIKRSEFTSITAAYQFLSQCRGIISILLDHDPEMGLLRNSPALTTISDDNRFQDQYGEFKAILEALRPSKNITIEYEGNKTITLKGTIQQEDGSEVEYQRSQIQISSSSNDINLSHCTNLQPLGQLANQAFMDLNNKNLSLLTQKELIARIYFYLADATPCIRGSASIAHMLYHALESAFIGEFSYFGKMTSKYGYSQGIMPDLAAMISPDFASFYAYLQDHIIDSGVWIRKTEFEGSGCSINKTILDKKLMLIITDLKNLATHLKNNNSFTNQIRTIETNRFITSLNFIKETLACEPQETGLSIDRIHFFLSALITQFEQNTLLYTYFYNQGAKGHQWSTPNPLKAIDSHLIHDKELFLNQFISIISTLRDYFSHVANINHYTDKTPHRKCHYLCKKLIPTAKDFLNGKNSNEGMSQFSDALEYMVKGDITDFIMGLNEFINLITALDGDKNVEHQDEWFSTLTRTYLFCPDPNIIYLDLLKKQLNTIFQNLEDVKLQLPALAFLAKSFKLDNKNLEKLLLPPSESDPEQGSPKNKRQKHY